MSFASKEVSSCYYKGTDEVLQQKVVIVAQAVSCEIEDATDDKEL